MNPNQHLPEGDDSEAPMSPLEKQLKQLRPRPATFDAEVVIRAAGERERQVELSSRKSPEQETRTARWLALAASWTWGAVAGALLMSLILQPRAADHPTTTPSELEGVAGAESSKPQPNHGADDSATASDEAANSDGNPFAAEPKDGQRRDDAVPPRDPQRPDAPQWSRDEWIVSTQLLDLRRPPAIGDAPLTAGCYVLRSRTPVSSVENIVAREPERSPHSDDRSLERAITPPLSVNPDQLLRELLGTRPGLRL